METNKNPIANPLVVLREEFDDWAILFDPDVGNAFSLGPVSVFIWKRLDGQHTTNDIVMELQDNCKNVPNDAKSHVKDFIEDLVKKGLAGYETKRV